MKFFQGWWKGEIDGRMGVFPDNFVKLLSTNTANTNTAQNQGSGTNLAKPNMGGKLTNSEVRNHVNL
jgi:hypothetical protein